MYHLKHALKFEIVFAHNLTKILDGVLKATLALYMEEETFPLPAPEEVLVCNPSTTTEEVLNFKMFISGI